MKHFHKIILLLSTFVFFKSFASENFEKSYDLVAIGEGMVDVIKQVSDEELNILMPEGYHKGDTSRIDNQFARGLFAKINNYVTIPGGSEANVTANFATLGGRVAINTVVADDEYGFLFKENLEKYGVTFLSPFYPKDKASTALCFTFITPDKDRTFAVDASISSLLDESYVNFDVIASSRLFYTDASNLDNGGNKSKIIAEAFKVAKNSKTEIVFNLNNNYFTNTYRHEILNLLSEVDILAGSEEVFKNLFNSKEIDDAISKALEKVKIVVATIGKRGAIVAISDYRAHIKTKATGEKIIDTTGAGDAFIAGFLFGHIKGKNIKEAGEIGASTAAQILYVKGGRPIRNLKEIVFVPN